MLCIGAGVMIFLVFRVHLDSNQVQQPVTFSSFSFKNKKQRIRLHKKKMYSLYYLIAVPFNENCVH